MTCNDVREQLLELSVDQFDTLAEHLDRCPACAALADRIRHQENEMNAYIDDYAHAPFDPTVTRPSNVRRLRWPIASTAMALAAAAALWVAAGGPPVPSGEPVEPGLAAAPADDVETIRFGVGRSALLALQGTPSSISVVDPSVASVQTVDGSNVLQVLGRAAGRSQLIYTREDGQRDVWWLDVVDDATAPTRSESDQVLHPPTTQLTVRVGERHFVDLSERPIAVAVTDPSLVAVRTPGAGELGFDGLSVGTTDVVVRYGVGYDVWVITVVP